MTDDEGVEALRTVAQAGTLPPPAPPEAVVEAEKVIGFPLPPLLRRLYTEVANGCSSTCAQRTEGSVEG